MTEFARTTYNYNSRFILNDTVTNTSRFVLLNTPTITDTLAINTEEVRPEEIGIVDFGTKLGKGEWEVPVTLYASTEANMNQLIQNLKEAFNPDLLELDATYGELTDYEGYHPLDWTETVGSDSRLFRMYVKSLEIPTVETDNMAGLIRASKLKLKLQDPRKYLQSQTTRSGAGAAVNAGTYTTPVVITVTASGATSTNLQLVNSTTSEIIYVTTALANNDVLVIDTRLHSVKLNGAERRDLIGSGTVWWLLRPGSNTLSIGNGTNASVGFAWRSAWPI